MARLSVYIIAYNEADKIEAALRSVAWADEIVVADSFSTDGTADIARKYTDKVLQVPFEGFGKLRNDVLAQLTGDWVFSLDADERCTEAAAAEIRRLIEQPGAADAYLRAAPQLLLRPLDRALRVVSGLPRSRSSFAAAS